MSTSKQETYELQKPPFGVIGGLHLINYLLHLADDALMLGHRNSEWCGHGPVLELDIAISNIALDLLGQARNFYQYAAEIINNLKDTNGNAFPMGGARLRDGQGLEGAVTEDTLAYLRDAHEFKNCLLVEQPNGDWGVTIMRQFLFSTYQYYLYQRLQHSGDERIAAIANKALKEVTYHVRWSSEWVIRLGIGTAESHARMLKAVGVLKDYTHELFMPAGYETEAALKGYGMNVTLLHTLWEEKVKGIFTQATLAETLPFYNAGVTLFGKEGQHTNHLETVLADMQYLQRMHHDAEW